MHNSTNELRTWLAIRVLGVREIKRFFRQRNRVIGAIGQPVLFWLLFGTGMHQTFQGPNDQSFSKYFIPGIVVLILLFSAIFATISIIEDRNEGFLQGVLVAPIPNWAMVLGKILGGVVIAVAQSLIFVGLALTVGVRIGIIESVQLVAFLTLSATALTCLGFVIAWRLDSTQGFHAIMSILLMPMWLLSGAFFPVPVPSDQSPIGQVVMHWLMTLNPVTYLVAGVRRMMYAEEIGTVEEYFFMPGMTTCWIISLVFCGLMFVSAIRVARIRTAGDLK